MLFTFLVSTGVSVGISLAANKGAASADGLPPGLVVRDPDGTGILVMGGITVVLPAEGGSVADEGRRMQERLNKKRCGATAEEVTHASGARGSNES